MSVIDVLELPHEAQVNRVVPKKQFFTQADMSGADKKRFDTVERVRWEYALKPESTNISAFHDETREYGEIEVLTVELRERKGVARLAEIMLRAMPYPLLLFFNHGDEWQLWMGQLRYSESEHGAMTVTEMQATEWLPETAELWRQMAFSNQRAADMYALYMSWYDTVSRWKLGTLSEEMSQKDIDGKEARERLKEIARIDDELVHLRAQMKKETQMNRRIELNMKISVLKKKRNTLTDIGGKQE